MYRKKKYLSIRWDMNCLSGSKYIHLKKWEGGHFRKRGQNQQNLRQGDIGFICETENSTLAGF